MGLFSFLRRKSDLTEELESHLKMAITDGIARGQSPAEARAAAIREFGNVPMVADVTRDQWRWLHLELWLHDIRYAMRQLRKSPGFTLTAILTLALGVGANTTVFSMINGLLLRPLAVPAGDRLVVMGTDGGTFRQRNYSFPESIFRGIESRHEVFSDVFAFDHEKFQVRSGSGNEIVPGQLVSGAFFHALQIPPLMGRTLTSEDDRTGGNPNGFGAVISESYWITRFNRAPDIIGRKLEIDRVAFTVVGVMPRKFFGADPLQRPQIYVPLALEPVINRERSLTAFGHHAWWLTVMARLQPGVSIGKADAQVASVTDAVLHERVPDAKWIASHEKQHFQLAAESGSAGFNYVRLNFRKPLAAVFAMCIGILLLACLNLASLLMARGTARQRELATRMAMGASRSRLIQQLLVEGLLLGVLGTLAGLAIAPVISKALVAMLLRGNGMVLDTSLDIRVFAFAALTLIIATLLFALAPAIQATSRNLIDRIKDGQHATQIHERRRILPRVLLGTEVGLALMLVVGAGLLASSLVRLYTSGEGFDPHGVQNIAFNMDKAGLKDDALLEFYREIGDRLRHQPGVKNVSFAQMVPMTGYQWDENFSDPAGGDHDIYMNSVAPSYFETMRIPQLAGRDFTWNDSKATDLKIILNQSAARLLAPDGNVIGRTIKNRDGDKTISYQVVGIVGDAKYTGLRSPAPPTAFVPLAQAQENLQSYQAVVRLDGPAGPLASSARALAMQLQPSIPVPEMTSMEAIIDESLGSERLMALLSVFFALCALAVTAVGLYGTLAYATARRTSEIGIRMALGARRAQVAKMVFGQNLWVVLGGAVSGLVAALLAARALSTFLYDTSARDPWVIAGSLLALSLIACAASLLPALRAARIEPIIAIRCE